MKNKRILIIPIIGIIIVLGFILYTFYSYSLYLNRPDNTNNNHNKIKKYNIKNLNYQIKESFENISNENRYKTYYYDNYDYRVDIDCNIRIEVEKNNNKYKTGKDYLNKEFTYYLADQISKIEKTTINNKNWYTIEKQEKYKTSDFYPDKPNYNNDNVYTYVTIDHNFIYIIEYTINDSTNGEYDGTHTCYTELDSFISSLKFNK